MGALRTRSTQCRQTLLQVSAIVNDAVSQPAQLQQSRRGAGGAQLLDDREPITGPAMRIMEMKMSTIRLQTVDKNIRQRRALERFARNNCNYLCMKSQAESASLSLSGTLTRLGVDQLELVVLSTSREFRNSSSLPAVPHLEEQHVLDRIIHFSA